MKYTIEGFSQEEALKIKNLDVVDLVILRWIVDFEPNMTKKEIDGEIYFWVNYQSLLDALPILNIKKLALYRRLEKMCNLEILKHKNIKDNGNYSYYTFGEKYRTLISSTIEPYISNDRTLISSTIEQNNSSIKEIHLLNNSKENIKERFNKFWDAYPKKVSKGIAEKWFIKNNPSDDLVNEMISKIKLLKQTEQWQTNNGKFIPYPSTWLNAKGWEDEIINHNSLKQNWMNEQIEQQEATPEEIQALERRLNGKR